MNGSSTTEPRTGYDAFVSAGRRMSPPRMTQDEIDQHKRHALTMASQGKSLAEIKAYMQAMGVPEKKKIDFSPGITPDYIMGAVTSAVHGFSYGFDDEAIGSLYGLVTGQGAQAGRDFYRARLQAFHDQNPGTDLALQIAGGIASGGVLASAAKRLAPRALQYVTGLPTWKTVVAAGGAGGAAYAAADVQGGIVPRLEAMPGGAMVGAIGSTALMGGAAAVGTVLRPLARGIPVVKKLLQSPGSQADEVILQDLLADGANLDDMLTRARTNIARGQPTTLADLAGENTIGRVSAIQAVPGPGKDLIKTGLVERQMGSGDRIIAWLAGKTKLGLGNVESVRDGLIGARALQAEQLYDEAYKAAVPMTDKLKALFRNEAFRKAYNQARTTLRETKGIDVPPLSVPFYPVGGGPQYGPKTVVNVVRDAAGRAVGTKKATIPPIQGPPQEVVPNEIPVAGLDWTKRYLDRIIRTGYGKESGWDRGVAHGLSEQLKVVLREVDELVPAYGKARSTYAGDSDVIAALDEGRKFLSTPADQIALRMSAYTSEAEREAAKLGFIEDIRDAIYNKKQKAPDVAQTVLGGKEMIRRIRAVFGDEADDFLARVRTEARFAETLRGAAAGSRTTPLAKVIEDWEQQSGGIMGAIAAGRPGLALIQVGRAAGIKFRQSHQEEVAAELAKRYTYGLDDPAELIGYLINLQSRKPRLSPAPFIAAPLGGQTGREQ